MDLFDLALYRALNKGGGGGDITVEPLTVTENGQYAAPSGKAYSPVNVEVSGGGRNVSYGTNAPDASAGSDGDIYFVGQEIQTKLIADSGYIVRDTQTLLSVGSRDFYKINPGEAIAVEAYGTNGYYGPVLISPDFDSVLYTENKTSAEYTSVTIDGVQWWVCGRNYWSRGPATKKNIVAYHSPKYPLPTGTGLADWVAGVLETCHAQIVDTTLLFVQEVYLKHNGIWYQGSNGLDPDWI